MAVRSSASRVLQALRQRGLLLQPARSFSSVNSDALDEVYSAARPPTVCFLGAPGVGKAWVSGSQTGQRTTQLRFRLELLLLS
jgi:putative ribosome biogenesis GTPase RsgA